MNALGAKATVAHLRFQGDDEALVAAIRRGHLGACAAFYDRYVTHVRKVITRIMGIDQELMDITNTVFCEALKSIDKLSDPARLKAWLTQIAVFTVRRCLRSRKRKRWLHFLPDHKVTGLSSSYEMDLESIATVRSVRRIIERLSADDHIYFSLRYLHFMELQEIADACGVSIRTAKRKVASSEKHFKKLAMDYPELAERLDSSPKWRTR